ncbi:MAG: class I SAM-dependent methyltransferase [Planctomycetota bacterium]
MIPREPETEVMDLAHEAEAYAHADFADVNAAFVARLVELADVDRAVAVDLGTGPADIPVRLSRLRPHWWIVAVDASPAMLAFASERLEEEILLGRIHLLLVDAKRTPFAERSFDVVFSNSILHHIDETATFWKEVARIAKPGAVIFLRDLARPGTLEEACEIVRRYAGLEPALLQEEYRRSLLASWTPEEIRLQLREADLTSLSVTMSSDRHLDVFGRLPS